MVAEMKDNTGELPCDPDAVVRVEFENGKIMEGYPAKFFTWSTNPDDHVAHGFAIKRWRVSDLPAIA